MKRTRTAPWRRYECGAVTIEAAFLLPVLLVFLGLPSLILAFYFLQYSAAQKAVHDVALYLSTAPRVEMTTAGSDGSVAAVGVAKKIVEREMAGVIPAGVPVSTDIFCIYQVAGTPVTKACTVTYSKDINHTLYQFDVSIGFNYVNPITNSDTGVLIAPYASVRYVGN